jgi:hypothetical protein
VPVLLQGTSRSWAWFFIRIITQLVGLGTALAGVTMVLVVFKNHNPGSKYWSWHQGIGLTALGREQLPYVHLALLVLQVLHHCSRLFLLLNCCICINLSNTVCSDYMIMLGSSLSSPVLAQ